MSEGPACRDLPLFPGSFVPVERGVKGHLRKLLAERRFEEIIALAAGKKRVLSTLVSLTFDPDALIVWRSIEAMGLAAERIAADDPAHVRAHLGRLHWLLNEESGGVCWHAPELMAVIVRCRPDLFRDYASIVVSLLETMEEEDLPRFRSGILWAIGTLADVAAREAEAVVPAVAGCLEDPDSQVRGMATCCLVQLGRRDEVLARGALLSDDGEVLVYRYGSLVRLSVGDLARQALAE